MARTKYYNETTKQWEYADMAFIVGGNSGGNVDEQSIYYNHISEITYEGEPTEDEIVPDVEETVVNLFDKDTMVFSKSLQSNGTVAGWGTSAHGKVPIEGNKTYSIQWNSEGTLAFSIAFALWDSNDTPLYAARAVAYNANTSNGLSASATVWSAETNATATDVTMRVDDNGKGLTVIINTDTPAYLIVPIDDGSTAVAYEETIMVEEGTACHDYVAYNADSVSGDDTSTETPDVSTQGNLAGCEITGLFGATLADTYARKNLSALADKMEEMTGLSDGGNVDEQSIYYNHISEITYEGEPTEDEIVPDVEETHVNLFDKDTMIKSGQVWRGEVSTGKGSHGVVPITGGKTYAFQRTNATYELATNNLGIARVSGSVYPDAASLCFYDADDNYLYGAVNVNNYIVFRGPKLATYEGEATAQIDATGKGIVVTTTEDVAFVRFLIQADQLTIATTDEDTIMLEEGDTCHDYVAYNADSVSGDDTSTETPDVSTQGNLAGCEITGLFGATLADTYARKNLSALAGKMEGLTGLSDDAIIDSGLRKFGYRIEPEQDDIPTVYANGESFADMTKDKNEVKMSFKYISKTDVFGGWMKIKWQGNLSIGFPKKNFTVKLYGDKGLDHKMKVDLKGWGLQNKFVWKANYIDRSHARNIVSARLWSDMVASRPTYDARMMYSPNHGAIDGFPFRLYVNGEYYGLMTWNIPKDGWMAEMTEDNKNHCILCAEVNNTAGTSSCDFAADYNASAWSVEFPDEITPGLIYSFNDIIACVVNDTDEDFKTNIDTHLDLYSALDYYLFFYLNGGTDSLAKNMLLMTFDGVKWYCGAYDMDGVWGRDAVSGAAMDTDVQCPEAYNNTNSLLWQRIEACFGQELHDRYFDLRETILSKEYIMAKFSQFVDQIPEDVYAEDVAQNSGMKGISGTAFLEEVSTWLDGRFTYVDAEMEAMVPTETTEQSTF